MTNDGVLLILKIMKESIKSKPFFETSSEKMRDVAPGVKRQFFGFDKQMMMVKVYFEKGAKGPIHAHVHTQTTYVASGKFEMYIGDETRILQAGDGFYTEPHIDHGCTCLESGILIDVFSPIREDFYDSFKDEL